MLICIVCLFLSCLKNLNTSHVNVNPRIRKNIGGNKKNLNTSHVNVNHF